MKYQQLWLARLAARFAVMQASWEHDLDVSGVRQRAAWWAWLVLGLGAAALMAAMDQLGSVHAAQDDAQAQIKRLERADRQMRLSRAVAQRSQGLSAMPAASGGSVAPLASASSSASGLAQADAPAVSLTPPPPLQGPALADVLNMARLLAYPWADHLSRVDEDAAAHRAVLTALSVNLDAVSAGAGASAGEQGQAVWRLQAAVTGDASALAWARHMPAGQVLSRDRLAQPFTSTSGNYTLKVDVQMRASPSAVWPSSMPSAMPSTTSGVAPNTVPNTAPLALQRPRP